MVSYHSDDHILTMGDNGNIWDGNPFLAVKKPGSLCKWNAVAWRRLWLLQGASAPPIASTPSMAIHGMQGLDS
jgi:hypothetical protein